MHYLGEVENIYNSLWQIYSRQFCQNRPGFVDDVTKNIWCVLGFAVPLAVHLQNTNAKFHKVV